MTTSIINTFHLRQTRFDKEYMYEIITGVLTYRRIQYLFDNYIKSHQFAESILFDDCFKAVY